MPTWLVHGFRWPRPLIRIHIILQDLEDAAADWVMAPATVLALTDNFRTLYPDIMKDLPTLRFIEQHDPSNLVCKDQPYAYLCDQVHEVALSVNIDEIRGKGVANESWEALADLRDKIAPGEEIGWFVVVNGDTERWVPPQHLDIADMERSRASGASSISNIDKDEPRPASKGLKGWLNRAKKVKSLKDIRGASKGANDPKSPRLPTRAKRSESASLPNKPPPVPSNVVKAAETAKNLDTPKASDETKSTVVDIARVSTPEEEQAPAPTPKPHQATVEAA